MAQKSQWGRGKRERAAGGMVRDKASEGAGAAPPASHFMNVNKAIIVRGSPSLLPPHSIHPFFFFFFFLFFFLFFFSLSLSHL
jgi:ABC-type Na+ efflux pump permease subunit